MSNIYIEEKYVYPRTESMYRPNEPFYIDLAYPYAIDFGKSGDFLPLYLIIRHIKYILWHNKHEIDFEHLTTVTGLNKQEIVDRVIWLETRLYNTFLIQWVPE